MKMRYPDFEINRYTNLLDGVANVDGDLARSESLQVRGLAVILPGDGGILAGTKDGSRDRRGDVNVGRDGGDHRQKNCS